MSDHVLMADLVCFEGKQLIECIDRITAIASARGYTVPVSVIGGEFKGRNIDNDSSRLNVRIDKDSIIRSFSIG